MGRFCAASREDAERRRNGSEVASSPFPDFGPPRSALSFAELESVRDVAQSAPLWSIGDRLQAPTLEAVVHVRQGRLRIQADCHADGP
eukprot:614658-Alexandrium_andersonii.AAC.1